MGGVRVLSNELRQDMLFDLEGLLGALASRDLRVHKSNALVPRPSSAPKRRISTLPEGSYEQSTER
jgi:hypothetical protein